MEYVTYRYHFFARCELQILHSLKFAKCEICGTKNEGALRNGIGIYIVTSTKLVFVDIMLSNLHEC